MPFRSFPALCAGAAIFFASQAMAAAPRPVVVELFTSQGCSSCPPADRFLSELGDTRADVLPLAFHVTYWNQLGWKDPYSFDGATQRQARYGERFRDGSYTPEMVVDGAAAVVGSDRGAAEAAIDRAKRAGVTAAAVSASRGGDAVAVSIGAGAGQARVLLVGYDARRATPVGRGENAGRTLIESNIVRGVMPIGEWNGAALTLHAAPVEGERLAVLLEAPDGRIVGAARVADAATPGAR
ncbi:DUF1223 domain-containing protein [Burkholderia plantarii]|uniref:DUF1223 domain-containing protein n=1 Tax=Burkholderia plantarii TaxID=41899 RepID=UPI0018DC57AB|nr:DUF1223 domain-containing protein [Burkholderia plantarii]MBI0329293.1 DUF1223 domain-containing protein [Burkholderia plantarii]